MSAAGAVPIKHCILMLPGSCTPPPPHEQYNANLVLTHSTKEWEVIPALPYLSYRNLTFSLLLKTPRQEVWSRHFALLLISWTQKFEDLEFFMIVYHTLHLIEVMYSNNLLLIVMQLQWSEWFVNVLKENVWGEQRGSCWTHGHQAPSSRRCVLIEIMTWLKISLFQEKGLDDANNEDRAHWVEFFSPVVGRFGSGRSVEIFNYVFPGTLFTLGQGGRSWQAFGERQKCLQFLRQAQSY